MNQQQTINPYLRGPFAPIDHETVLRDLPITGRLPDGLAGSFYRNGPNVQFPPRGDYHLFSGDGMTHAFHIRDGQVDYCNRWIRTAKYKLEAELGRSVIDYMNPFNCEEGYLEFLLSDTDGLANTSCVWHGNRLLILEEGHRPFEVDPRTLESIGSCDFGGRLQTAMTAHPKIDPVSGEMLFFAYMSSGPFAADVTLHTADANGVLGTPLTVPLPYAAMVHDFVVTEHYVLLPIFPLIGSLDRAMAGQPPFVWEPSQGASLGIVPRGATSADAVRWVEMEPKFVFHFMNAFEQGERIMVDACEFTQPPLFPTTDGTTENTDAVLHRWRVELGDGARVVSEPLQDHGSEFPVVDPRCATRPNRHGWFAAPDAPQGPVYNCVGHIDHATGTTRLHAFGDRRTTGTSEPVFVPRAPHAEEGDGWLLSVVTDMETERSALHVLDARDMDAPPVAVAHLPHRVPVGFHGHWKPAD